MYMDKFIEQLKTGRGFMLALIIISGFAGIARLINIDFPAARVFDEVYSPKFAADWLNGREFFDVHPFLTQFSQLPGLLLFGDVPTGWRFSAWLWGMVFVWAAAYAAYFLTGKKAAGIVMALLVSLDTAYFVYGRTGLPDMFLLSQLALTLAFFFGSMRAGRRSIGNVAIVLAGIFLGNTISTKWLGLGLVGSVWCWLIINAALAYGKKHGKFLRIPSMLPNANPFLVAASLTLLPAAVYSFWLWLLFRSQPTLAALWDKIKWWHWQVYNYHHNLTATHPYGSAWWEWPIQRKPVLFFYQTEDAGRRVINSIGNVLLWWAGFAALIGSLAAFWYRKFRPQILWLLLSALFFWLPWAVISRVSFSYHFFESYFFELLLVTLVLVWAIDSDKPRRRNIAAAFLVLAFIVFLVMYPETAAMLIPNAIPPKVIWPY